jgi:hypothetical protein
LVLKTLVAQSINKYLYAFNARLFPFIKALAKHKEKYNKKLVAISRILKRIKQKKLIL